MLKKGDLVEFIGTVKPWRGIVLQDQIVGANRVFVYWFEDVPRRPSRSHTIIDHLKKVNNGENRV